MFELDLARLTNAGALSLSPSLYYPCFDVFEKHGEYLGIKAVKEEDPLGKAMAQDRCQSADVDDDLDAATLRLGDHSGSESESEADGGQDCVMQLPHNLHMWESPECGHSGWPRSHVVEMCVALMQHLASEQAPIMKWLLICSRRFCLSGLFFGCLKALTCVVLSSASARAQHLPAFMDHVEWAFSKYGLRASTWLGTPDHIEMWESRYFHAQKALAAARVKKEPEEGLSFLRLVSNRF